jgi:hypothetical protein
MQLYGANALRAGGAEIQKRAAAFEDEFCEKADALYDNSDLDRVSCLRATRLTHKALFKRMQRA